MTTPTLTLEAVRNRATVSVEEAAALLGVGRNTAYRMAKDGKLPTLDTGRRSLLVPVPRLLAMLGEE